MLQNREQAARFSYSRKKMKKLWLNENYVVVTSKNADREREFWYRDAKLLVQWHKETQKMLIDM